MRFRVFRSTILSTKFLAKIYFLSTDQEDKQLNADPSIVMAIAVSELTEIY